MDDECQLSPYKISGNSSPPGNCEPPISVATKPAHIVMSYAKPVHYDHSMNPKDIDWISDDVKAKISPYEPNNMILSNNKVAAAEKAFTAIFASTP